MLSLKQQANFLSNSSASENITIVIASFYRNVQLSILIDYYLSFGFYVHVAYDSDEELLRDDPRLQLKKLKGSFTSRCGFLAKDINTKYAMLVTDDDIFLGEEIITMIQELRESDDVSIFGQVLGSWFNGGDFQISPTYLPFEDYTNFYTDINSRVIHHFRIARMTPISMYRLTYAAELIKLLRFFSELEFVSTPYIYEISAEILLNAGGTSRRTSRVYWIRNWEENSISNNEWNRNISFLDWFHSPAYQSESIKWIALVGKYCEGLDVSQLVHHFQVLWDLEKKPLSVQKYAIRSVKFFFRRSLDFFRHHYTSYFKLDNLHRRVKWNLDTTQINRSLKVMYLYRSSGTLNTEM